MRLESYVYGFNSQAKDNELYGEGNSYTAEFWQYDTRLGRRWNVDPMSNKFPWQSLYSAFDNNPILFVDSEGDSTRYCYQGQLIGIAHDGLGQLVTFLDTERQLQQAKDLYLSHFKAGGDIDDPTFNSKLQAIGTTYDLAQFQSFYEFNKNDVRKEAPYPGYVNEHGTYLYKGANGVIGIGKENIPSSSGYAIRKFLTAEFYSA